MPISSSLEGTVAAETNEIVLNIVAFFYPIREDLKKRNMTLDASVVGLLWKS